MASVAIASIAIAAAIIEGSASIALRGTTYAKDAWQSIAVPGAVRAVASVASYGIRCQLWHPLPCKLLPW